MGLRHHIFFLVSMTTIVLLVTGMNSTRVPKVHRTVFGNDGLWNSRLPRGPVPPSGPSLCHNMLKPVKESRFVYPQDQTVICP
ncbi:hypothetical protein R6Q59_030265 [Mikania micrantha]